MSAAFVGGFLFMACGYVLLRCGMPIPAQQQTCCTLRRKHLTRHRLISASVVCFLVPTGSPPMGECGVICTVAMLMPTPQGRNASKTLLFKWRNLCSIP